MWSASGGSSSAEMVIESIRCGERAFGGNGDVVVVVVHCVVVEGP